METVAHDGRRTAFRRFDRGGERTTVLLIHGSGGTHAIWRGQQRLADRWPVVALDLSGHGASADVAVPAGPATLAVYVEDVTAVAEAVDAGVLVGTSLGGAVALTVAVEARLDLDAMVLAGSGAKLAVRSDLLGWFAEDFDRAIEFLHAPGRLFASNDPRHREASEAAMRAVGRRVTERDFRTCDAFDLRDRLDEIRVPTLAITGSSDELTPPRYHEYLAERLPAGRWTTIDGAAHLSMLERPTAFNAAVSTFLEEVGV